MGTFIAYFLGLPAAVILLLYLIVFFALNVKERSRSGRHLFLHRDELIGFHPHANLALRRNELSASRSAVTD